MEAKIVSKTIESKVLDGKNFYYGFLAGAKKVLDSQQLLNSINVFPVKDGDTGTNLASTLRSIIDTIIPTTGVREAAAAVADAALVGARGNSGIIFAQFLYGFSNELNKTSGTVDLKSFAVSVRNAVKYAYQAISQPIEGTIITVMREWAEYFYQIKDKSGSFFDAFLDSYHKAEDSLKATPEKLEILAKNNVVDSGAKGFVLFLGGIIELLKTGNLKELTYSRNVIKVTDEEINSSEGEITFRYCTEALLSGSEIDKDQIRSVIEKMGDSLVVAGSSAKVRVHIHTDNPIDVFTQLRRFGCITFQKVDDMVMQQSIIENRKAPIAIVTDSTCDLPKQYLDQHQITMLPLSVHFEESYFLDKVTIDYKQFKKLFDKAKTLPTTAQPSYKDFTNKYAYLSTHYDSIIAIQVTSKMSGTSSTSSKAAKSISQQTKEKISVFDSRSITGGLGLMVLRAAQMAEAGFSHNEICEAVEQWRNKVLVVVSGTTTKYMVRSGRLDPVKGFIARIFNFKPAVSVEADGAANKLGTPMSEKGAIKLIENKVKQFTEGKKIWNYVITHVSNETTAQEYINFMKELTGTDPLYIDSCTPVIATNVGPGTAAISILLD